MRIARFCLRVLMTPVFVLSFGYIWIGFVCFVGPLFWLFAFLENERFNWKEHLTETNEWFCEPLKMWRKN